MPKQTPENFTNAVCSVSTEEYLRCPSNIHSLGVPFRTRLDFFFLSSISPYVFILSSMHHIFPRHRLQRQYFFPPLELITLIFGLFMCCTGTALCYTAAQLLFYKHIVTVVVQRAVVSSDHTIAPDKPETHATALQVFKIVKPW